MNSINTKEHFIVKIPDFRFTNTFYIILSSLIISFLIIYPVMGLKTMSSIFAIIIMTIIFYIIISNMSQENKSSYLPSTAYPVPPHLGLDGISIDSLIAGM